VPKLTDGGVVLDTSAILALVQNEAGAAKAASLSYGASLSAVNLTEVVSKLNDFSVSMAKFGELMRDFAIKVIPFDEPFAYAAGALRNDTRAYGLSLGDRACLWRSVQSR
jgi:PIN domain nuclease of toxin-antitoxin system